MSLNNNGSQHIMKNSSQKICGSAITLVFTLQRLSEDKNRKNFDHFSKVRFRGEFFQRRRVLFMLGGVAIHYGGVIFAGRRRSVNFYLVVFGANKM